MSEGPVATGAAMLSAANAGTDNPAPVADSTSPTNIPTPPVPSAPPAAPVQNGNLPPYAKHLEKVPEGFRPLVEPTFKEWDADVTRRLQEVHSRYEPYKQFLDAQVAPEQLREAMDLYRMMVENPERIYEAMGQHLGITQQQAGAEQGQEADEDEFDLGGEDPHFDLEKDPRFKAYAQQQQELARQQQIIVESMQQARQQQEEAEGEAWLNQRTQEITADLQQKGIEPDWDYVLTLASSLMEHKGMDHDKALDTAVGSYVTKVQSYMQRPTAGQSAPMVLPTSGGTPSTQTPVFESGKQRREYGAAALRAALRNNT